MLRRTFDFRRTFNPGVCWFFVGFGSNLLTQITQISDAHNFIAKLVRDSTLITDDRESQDASFEAICCGWRQKLKYIYFAIAFAQCHSERTNLQRRYSVALIYYSTIYSGTTA